jgi:hypothetical protein
LRGPFCRAQIGGKAQPVQPGSSKLFRNILTSIPPSLIVDEPKAVRWVTPRGGSPAMAGFDEEKQLNATTCDGSGGARSAVTQAASAADNPYQRGSDPTAASVTAARGMFATARNQVNVWTSGAQPTERRSTCTHATGRPTSSSGFGLSDLTMPLAHGVCVGVAAPVRDAWSEGHAGRGGKT